MTEPTSILYFVGKGAALCAGVLVPASVVGYLHRNRLGPLLILERGIRYTRAIGFLVADMAVDLIPTVRDRWPGARAKAEERR